MMLKAETNIVTSAGEILSGESFNPDTYKMPKKEVERLISIGALTWGKSEKEKAEREKVSREEVPAPSKADSNDERTPDPSTGA